MEVLQPPPANRTVIDKTADFVVRNGPAFEHKILINERNNPMFNFLRAGDAFHPYYRRRLQELRALLSGNPLAEPVVPSMPAPKQAEPKEVKPVVPLKPPDPEEWIFDLPRIPSDEVPVHEALLLETIKLTAQFTAKNGRAWAIGLQNRVPRDEQYDFLKPQHFLNKYFTQLVEQYQKIVYPPGHVQQKLAALRDKQKVYSRLMDKVAWEQEQKKLKEGEDEEAKERIEFQQIDWFDFVVVETISFDDEEAPPGPPPVLPGSAATAAAAASQVPAEKAKVKIETMDDIDMEVEMDDDDDEDMKSKIRHEPFRPKPVPSTRVAASTYKCPKCGEVIPAEEAEEHMRIELLDPEERRRRLEQMRRRRVAPLAEGTEITQNLTMLTKYRSDIFGEGLETEIGKVPGAEERPKPKVTWDGHTGSIAMTATAVMSGHDPARVEPSKPLPGPSIPSSSSSSSAPPIPTPTPIIPIPVPNLTPTPAGALLSTPGVPPISIGGPPPPHMSPFMPMRPQMGQMGPMGPMGPIMGMPSPGMGGMMAPPPMPYGIHQGPPGMPMHPGMVGGPGPLDAAHPVPDASGQPNAKKQRVGPQLLSEEEFLAAHPGPINVHVAVPSSQDNPEWNFNGQTLSVSMDPKQTITDLKNLIKEQLGGMPPSKMKLELKGIGFLKDSASLASFNINDDSLVTLGVKARGRGGKK